MTYWFWVWLEQITLKKKNLSAVNPRGEVWRNLVIVSGRDEAEAIEKAWQIGIADQGDSRGSLRLDGEPAVAKFLGISDIGLIHDGLEDGSEILFRQSRETMRTARARVKTRRQLAARLKKEMAPLRYAAKRAS